MAGAAGAGAAVSVTTGSVGCVASCARALCGSEASAITAARLAAIVNGRVMECSAFLWLLGVVERVRDLRRAIAAV